MASCSALPVCPEYMVSHPRPWYPHACSIRETSSTATAVNGVASPSLPTSDDTLRHQRLDEVADRHAGGDGVRVDDEVGTVPSAVQGMSSWV